MQPKIIHFSESTFVGISRCFSLVDYQVSELWQSFMPRRHEIQNVKSKQLFNIQVNPSDYSFDPKTEFEKWAALEVDAFTTIPEGMQKLIIPTGRYTVFTYRGDGSNTSDFFRSIFTQWLPEAGLCWENRPQFEVLTEKYKKNSPESEELIYIPVL